ncbi:MAG TPA: AAA family ATPase [Trebonia sp.]|nr:AAA family ATPase [Trebonia sp.]
MAAALIGRTDERFAIDQLLIKVRAGRSQALVVHGEVGVGKTALLHYLIDQAAGCRVVRATGIDSEIELPWAGLHQLCLPLLDGLGSVPDPQRDALRTAFGISAGPPPDRFLVGLAVLSLLSAAAGDQPLIGIVDDAQWLDQASSQALGFAARRLAADPVGLVFATRVPGEDAAGLPRLAVDGLRAADAQALLDAVLTGPVDPQVRDLIIAETGGNPLALLELPRGRTPEQLAGGFGLPGAMPLVGRIEENFRRQISVLPLQTRRLLTLAAADPSGDSALVQRAAQRLRIGMDAAAPATDARLAHFDSRVWFRHPLVRSAAYQAASGQERRLVHAALAEVTDSVADPDRRAWHRAQAASGLDEGVAAELEHSAGRARARGGLVAAAAFLERATMFTLDPARRAGRALAAAQAKAQAGAFDAARDLLTMAEAGPLTEFDGARVELLRAQLAFAANHGDDAPLLLLQAARRLERIDAGLARAAYLEALSAALFAGRLGSPGGTPAEVARAVGAAPRPPRGEMAPDLLLDGLAAHFNEGYAAGVPILRKALAEFGVGMSADEELRWLWLARGAAMHIWDDEAWSRLSLRFVQLVSDVGWLSELPLALGARAFTMVFAGELTAAAALVDEVRTATEATGGNLAPYAEIALAAWRGDETAAAALIETTTRDAAARGEGVVLANIAWAQAVLYNGYGRYPQALAAAGRASSFDGDLGPSSWALVEMVEAAVRAGMTDAAATALTRLSEMTSVSGTDWALGIEARSRALLSDGKEAETCYQEAVARLGRTRLRPDLARAHLLYGEWLRRERRRGEAREQLRIAHDLLEAMGMDAFPERARHELRATGETARKRVAGAIGRQLTPQEAQIARLARDGLSNPEIGARLFISARTVQYHLSKVFAKLGVGSRVELHRVLADYPAAKECR